MMNILERIWNGELEPVAYSGTNSKEIKDLEKLMNSIEENLKGELNEKSQVFFERYSDCIDEYISFLTERAFCGGFGLAIRIFTESFTHSEEILKS